MERGRSLGSGDDDVSGSKDMGLFLERGGALDLVGLLQCCWILAREGFDRRPGLVLSRFFLPVGGRGRTYILDAGGGDEVKNCRIRPHTLMSGNQLGTYSVTRVSFSTEGDQYLEIQCNRLLSVTSGCYAVMASSIQYKSQQHTLYKTQN